MGQAVQRPGEKTPSCAGGTAQSPVWLERVSGEEIRKKSGQENGRFSSTQALLPLSVLEHVSRGMV